MFLCNADKSGRVLALSYGRHVGVEEMRRGVEAVRALMDNLKPGFLLLADLSTLESMDASCAPELGAIMDLCREKGVSTVLRVIPDRNKDIGFNLISRFHYHAKVKTETYESLSEAINSLLAEPLAAIPTDLTST